MYAHLTGLDTDIELCWFPFPMTIIAAYRQFRALRLDRNQESQLLRSQQIPISRFRN